LSFFTIFFAVSRGGESQGFLPFSS